MLTIISGIFTGLGLFLLGMRFLTDGLEKITSSRLKNMMRNLNMHPIMGVLIGVITTGILQSSSGTTIIVVGLVEARLLTLYQATAIIMGANIGTTVTSQLIAFNVGRYAFISFFIGLLLSFHKKNKPLRFLGETLLGFSLIFIGIDTLSKGIFPLQSFPRFQEILLEFGKTPVLGVIMGFCTTAIIQSSGTGVAILQSLASSNVISLIAAITILLGQNIGTCVTTLLASLHLSRIAKRAAFIHLFFNFMGVLLIFPFISTMGDLAFRLSPENIARQIANAHSLFNIISTIIFIPFIPVFVKIASFLVPD